MIVCVGDFELVLDFYDYDFYEDLYLYYCWLWDEVLLYCNEECNFWVVLWYYDVL